ncbi:MAG: lysophospholipid acyltransferase family protein [bacterium]
MRKLKHYLEYMGVKFLSWLIALLSLNHARALGRLLGRLTFSVFRIRRNVTLTNLKHAFPEKIATELFEIAAKTYEHFGMVMVEFLRVLALPQNAAYEAIINVKNNTILEAAHKAGKGAICLTAHFGNWEYAGGWLAYRGYPMVVMVQEQSNPYVDKMFRLCRKRMGMHTIPRGTAMRSYLKALKAGEYAVMLADQDAGQDGVFVDFFGKKASTAAGPARFHLKTGAPILMFMTYRDDDGQLNMEIEKLSLPQGTNDKEKALLEIMQAYHHCIEKWIRRYPHHWFWMHKRWKTQPQKQTSETRETA